MILLSQICLEVVATDISIEEDSRLPSNEFRWVSLEKDGINYLACSKGTTFLLYTIDNKDEKNATSIGRYDEFDVDGRVLTFTLFDVESKRLQEGNDIVVVMCVESDQGVTSLRWYQIMNHSLELFLIWNIKEPTKDIKYVRYGDQNKLLLLFNGDNYGTPVSLIDVYSFNLDFENKDYGLW